MSEAGRGFELGLAWGMMILGLMVVVVCGDTVLVSGSHIHVASVFAGSGTIGSHSPGPAFARAGGGAVGVLQRLVFNIRTGVGTKRPHLADGFAHVNWCCSQSRQAWRERAKNRRWPRRSLTSQRWIWLLNSMVEARDTSSRPIECKSINSV